MALCQFHPTQGAVRRCAHCNTHFCDSCCDESPLAASRGGQHRCFVCAQTLDTVLRAESNVPPFWRRLSDIYRYPLGMSALLVISLSALLSALLTGFGVFNILPSIVITLYSFACLRETAQGQLNAPSLETLFDGSNKPLGSFVGLLICVGILVFGAFYFFGMVAATVVFGFFIITMPASIMVIAIDEDLVDALNPAKLISVVAETGTAYFVMLLFLIMMISSVALLGSLFHESEPTFSGVFIQALIGNYYNVVEFHILGYLVHQNRYKLGFASMGSHSDSLARDAKEFDNAKLEVLIKAGEYTAAAAQARRQIDEPGSELWKWSRCFKLMCVGSTVSELSKFTSHYLDKLDTMGQTDAMATAYMTMKKKARDFSISDDQRCLDVAHSLFAQGRYTFVVDMLQNFHKRNADSEHINQSLQLVSASYMKIPGREKNARFYQTIYELRNNNR